MRFTSSNRCNSETDNIVSASFELSGRGFQSSWLASNGRMPALRKPVAMLCVVKVLLKAHVNILQNSNVSQSFECDLKTDKFTPSFNAVFNGANAVMSSGCVLLEVWARELTQSPHAH